MNCLPAIAFLVSLSSHSSFDFTLSLFKSVLTRLFMLPRSPCSPMARQLHRKPDDELVNRKSCDRRRGFPFTRFGGGSRPLIRARIFFSSRNSRTDKRLQTFEYLFLTPSSSQHHLVSTSTFSVTYHFKQPPSIHHHNAPSPHLLEPTLGFPAPQTS